MNINNIYPVCEGSTAFAIYFDDDLKERKRQMLNLKRMLQPYLEHENFFFGTYDFLENVERIKGIIFIKNARFRCRHGATLESIQRFMINEFGADASIPYEEFLHHNPQLSCNPLISI